MTFCQNNMPSPIREEVAKELQKDWDSIQRLECVELGDDIRNGEIHSEL